MKRAMLILGFIGLAGCSSPSVENVPRWVSGAMRITTLDAGATSTDSTDFRSALYDCRANLSRANASLAQWDVLASTGSSLLRRWESIAAKQTSTIERLKQQLSQCRGGL